ncbi:hypothetical protein QPK87_28520, partial [Kamptonema cortianum]|nr:hypothetical protein [Kamptonema cortianum]
QTSSLSSVKQLGTSQQIYMADYDDNTVPYLWYNENSVWITWMEMAHPYAKNTQIYLNPAQTTSPTTYSTGCAPASNPTVVSHYVMPLWIHFSYWNWWGTAMASGFPITPNAITSAPGQVCDPAILAANAYRACVAPAHVEGPSTTTVLVPGYFISYKRPAPAPEAAYQFGSACTTGFGPDPADQNQLNNIQVFRKGGNYGMVDTSARWYASNNMNKNNSRTYTGGPAPIPASPYMQVK